MFPGEVTVTAIGAEDIRIMKWKYNTRKEREIQILVVIGDPGAAGTLRRKCIGKLGPVIHVASAFW